MKIVSWNVNGLRAIIKKNFLEYIENEKPDIIGLQETKLQESQIPQEIIDLKDYYKFWSFAEKKGYSGVALFSKIKPKKITYSMRDKNFDSEGRTIIAEYDDFTLINCYFPNGQKDEIRLQYKLDFYDKMLDIMQEITSKKIPLLVCGDFNTAHKEIDLKNPKSNEKRSGFLPIEREWLDKIFSLGYIDSFRKFNKESGQYSWWSYRFNARKNNAGWRIDYFVVNKYADKFLVNAFIQQDVFGSDHCPIGVEYKINNDGDR